MSFRVKIILFCAIFALINTLFIVGYTSFADKLEQRSIQRAMAGGDLDYPQIQRVKRYLFVGHGVFLLGSVIGGYFIFRKDICVTRN